MARIKYTPNKKNFEALVQSEAVAKACERGAFMVRDAAKQTPLPTTRFSEGFKRRHRDAYKAVMAKVQARKGTRAGAVVKSDFEREFYLGKKYRILYNALEAIDGKKL